MRILLACESYYPSVGGVQEVIRQLAERLVERGHRVTVATSHLADRTARIVNGVEIVEFRISGNAALGMQGDLQSYRTLVMEGEHDVFMVKAAQQWALDALIPVLERIRKPKVLVPCGFSGLYEPVFAEYFRRMPEVLAKFDHLIFYASDYRDINLARQCGLIHYSVIPNGASEREFNAAPDPQFRRRHRIAEDAFVVLTVGSLTGFKGHRELTEAFEQARFSGRQAALVLNGARIDRTGVKLKGLRDALRARYSQGGLVALIKGIVKTLLIRAGMGRLLLRAGHQIEPARTYELLRPEVRRIGRTGSGKAAFLVDFPRSELVQAYLASDLFVFASNIEYSPLVLFEAAAAGLPFLSVPVGNAEEIARWTQAGEICPAPQDRRGYTRVDPAVLAGHIERLAADPQRLEALGKQGRRNWAEKFTWERITDQYEAVFHRLLSQGRARSC